MSKITVLGGGESGVGSAILAKTKGLGVFLSDGGRIKDKYRAALLEYGIDFEEGGHTLTKILDADTIIKSPGIPDLAETVRRAAEAGIPVISEIEFAGRYCDAKKICITGSNGKTTTATLIYEILRRAGMNAVLAGNIGESFAWKVAAAKEVPEWYVIELSSFQLDGMYDFRTETAVLLNITPDHLDRYDHSVEKYAQSKMRITQGQRPEDIFVYNHDDRRVAETMSETEIEAARIPFSVAGRTGGAWFDGKDMRYKDFAMTATDMKIKGLHNISNALAAIAAAYEAGAPEGAIRDTLRGFGGVEHRLEPVRTIDGVEYINDSKATNVDAAWFALESMTRPTVWIAGGTDKGNDYSALEDMARRKAKALVCMGVDNSKLKKAFEAVIPVIEDTHSLEEAMKAVARHAANGDAVLLSPACASFDLFRDYEDRGRQFKDKVHEI